jgi:hypothetical protein
MAYTFLDPKIGVDAAVSATATFGTAGTDAKLKWPLGYPAAAVDPTYGHGEFVYVAGGASVAAGNAVVFRGANSVSQLATASNGSAARVGVAYGAISASNVAGWVQVRGFATPVTISSAATAGDLCKIGSTAGCIERSPAASVAVANQIYGMFVASSQSASSAAGVVVLDYPYISGV